MAFLYVPNGCNMADWTPAMDIQETDGEYLIKADLPDVTKDDVKVEIRDGTISVSGERKQEKEEKREGYFHSERSYGKFYRSMLLPEGVKADLIAAHFNNGVLEVTVPLAEKAKRQEIPVKEPAKEEAKKAA